MSEESKELLTRWIDDALRDGIQVQMLSHITEIVCAQPDPQHFLVELRELINRTRSHFLGIELCVWAYEEDFDDDEPMILWVDFTSSDVPQDELDDYVLDTEDCLEASLRGVVNLNGVSAVGVVEGDNELEDDTVEDSSGNVFFDLGQEKATEEFVRSMFAVALRQIIDARGQSQIEIAEAMGVDEPKVNAILRDKVRGFSLGRLVRYINRLGGHLNVKIVMGEEGAQPPMDLEIEGLPDEFAFSTKKS